mgnify:CR=1 FL=1
MVDALDKCPNEAESNNGYRDDDGCPDTAPTYVFKSGERIVFHNILFATAKWDLLPASFAVLDEIAKSLSEQPSVRVRVEGHTDDAGTPQHNIVLSQQRALAVVNDRGHKGSDSRRREYTGFGDTRPVAGPEPVDATKRTKATRPRFTDDQRTQNRRVEFLTIDGGAAETPSHPNAVTPNAVTPNAVTPVEGGAPK